MDVIEPRPSGPEGMAPRRGLMPERRQTRFKRVAGISARTSNAAEMDPRHAQIPRLWGRFASDGWSAKLEGLGAAGPVHAVYCDYESDVSGPYRLLVGRQITGSDAPPREVEVVSLPAGDYLVFRCSGPMPKAVVEGWQRVWQFFAEPSAPRRAYTADFELYDGQQTPDIWVAVLG